MYIHCLLYVPTISISNSIAFTHMKDAEEEFGPIRMGGTIGWILVAWPFTFLLVDWKKVAESSPKSFVDWLGTALGSPLTGEAAMHGAAWAFAVAGFLSLILAVYSFFLPHTPPRKGEALAWLEAFKLLRLPFLAILWFVTFIDASVHQCYFSWTFRFLTDIGIPSNWVQPIMSIGQIAEILTMLILGVTLKRLGWKATMIVGIMGHAIRFAVFAFFPNLPWLIVAVNILHGICYAFFFATVYIFVDAYFPKDARSSAQGLFNFMILGLGPLAANSVAPWLHDEVFMVKKIVDGKETLIADYKSLFLVPCVAAIAAIVIMALFFHPPAKTVTPEPEEA
jgi:hypothetical protein